MLKCIVKNSFLTIILIASDILAISLSFMLAYYLRSWFLVDFIHLFPKMIHGMEVYLKAWTFLSLWLLIFAYQGLYPSVGMGFWDETKSLLSGNALAFTILILLTFITKTSIDFSRPVISLALMFSIVILPLVRSMMRLVLRRAGLWQKPVLIVGFIDAIKDVLCNLKKHPDWGLYPVAVVIPGGHEAKGLTRLPVYRNIESAMDIPVRVEEVIVAMPGLNRNELIGIIESSMKVAPVVKMLPDLYGIASTGVKTYDLDGMLLLEMEDRLALKRNSGMKRSFDIICSLTGLLILSPLFFLIIILIKLDSRGPAFFGHRRLGKGGNLFTCYKFRTMQPNAQEVLQVFLKNDPETRAQWEKDVKLKEDPRITRMGLFLRKTSLDELPQLWNVIKGDMSLVGPRPIISEEVEKYGEKLRYLFKVSPGITGLWQVSGRNNIDYEERVLLDEYYAKNWSIWLDIEIIIRTFGAVLKQEGAY